MDFMTDSLLAGIGDLLAASVREDLGAGDVTSEALVPEDALARAEFVSKDSLVVAGIPVVRELVCMYEPALKFHALASDGARVSPGSVLIEVEGRARAIFAVERISLNFLQRLSGIATLTSRFVTAVEGTNAVIVDTRKTIPGHRMLDKYGVRCGGGANHRMGLFDAVLIKNNHLEFHPDAGTAVALARERAGEMTLEVEVRDMNELESALEAGPDVIMLDNFTLEMTSRAVEFVGGRVVLEASGGIDIQNARAYAETGVDRIAVGALTHSVPASDIHLRVSPLS